MESTKQETTKPFHWQVDQIGVHLQSRGRDWSIPWADIAGIYFPVFGNRPFLRTHSNAKFPLPQAREELKNALHIFYKEWHQHYPQAAKKNGFDYGESPKSGAGLMIAISVLFCFLLGGVLVQEASTQRNCSQALSAGPVLVDAELLKLKKRQQGNFTVNLQFQTQTGETIQGKRLTLKKYQRGDADPTRFSVVYAATEPACWVMSEEYGKNDINWAKRRYTEAFDMLVGLSFLIIGALGVILGVSRLRQTRPFAAEVNQWLSIK